ncbi:phosphate transport system substrate-binding protein [Nakamurella sp. UYEF19]|uniref:phosphate ABC transporter substrate-binding protein PstS n=1 Tax=Nakamurella sp. UYEF19 TaxID=1756392 RepID=UPI003397F3E6
MQITRTSGLVALLAVGALTLSACGSDSNTAATPSTSSSTSSSAAVVAPSSTAPSSSAPAMSSGPATSAMTSGPATSAMTSGPATSGAMTSGASSSAAPTGGLTFAGSGFTCATGSLRSSGSTAQGTVIAQWIKDYNAKCGATINTYGGGGSGKGVTDFTSNQTDFGGSDSALKTAQFADAKSKRCNNNDAIDLPMVTGPIALSYNLSGVSKLILTPAVLVGIFGGKITKWNDAAIAAINPGTTLPDLAIATVHRSDSSGTTDNFTKYLTAAGGWTFEGGKSWTAPGGTGSAGSDGVAKSIGSTTGAIGYVEWGFAQSNKLSIAEIDNGAGAVELTAETAGKAVAAAKIVGTGKDLTLKVDYAAKTAGAYPVILVTYEVVCSAGNGDKAALLKSFLGYTATDGQTSLATIGAAPLPAEIQAKVVEAVKTLA